MATTPVFEAMIPALFEERVDRTEQVEGGCLLWKGLLNPISGYGQFTDPDGVYRPAHRVSYELFKGPLPTRRESGMVIDHLCMVRACVNPDHLELVTHQENCRRAFVGKHKCQDPTHTPIRQPDGHYRCQECYRAYRREWQRAYRARKKAEGN